MFLIAGIDGNKKVFTVFWCFIQSEETYAYYWALRIALKNLVEEWVLSFIQCIASDTEEAMFGPMQGMIHNVPFFNKYHHLLDKFHVLTKEWKDNVTNTITGDEPKTIVGVLLFML